MDACTTAAILALFGAALGVASLMVRHRRGEQVNADAIAILYAIGILFVAAWLAVPLSGLLEKLLPGRGALWGSLLDTPRALAYWYFRRSRVAANAI